MWWRTVLVFNLLAIIDNISAQDDTNGTETQSKLCCPCPPGWNGDTTNLVAQSIYPETSTVSAAHSPVGVASGPVGGVEARSALDGMDDCPCRPRDADSEGAASLFFPNAVRAFGNVVRPDPKEESKPLLHPEVDLASSVLETLREATDEEYRDALERDAARATASEIPALADIIADGAPEEARNVVTIIVSPRDMAADDSLPEASHVQETRCIHSSLGNPRASFILEPLQRATTPQKGIEDILNLPLPSGLLHRQRDSNLAASNVRENIAMLDDNLNKILDGLRLRADPTVLNFDAKKINENISNILNEVNLGIKAGNSALDHRVPADSNAAIDLANDKVSSEVDHSNDNISTNVPEKKLDLQSDNQVNVDASNTIFNNNKETILQNSAKNTGLLKSLLRSRSNGEILHSLPQADPFSLKKLLKLRDVELVPLDILKNVPKTKMNIPIIKINPLQNTNSRNPTKLPTHSVLFGKSSKITDENDEMSSKHLDKDTTAETSANIQTIPKRKVVTTDILDAVLSPSEDNCIRLKPEADKSAGVDMGELEDSLLNSSTETVETNEKLANDVRARGDDDTDISDIASVENLQLDSSEVTNNEETDFPEDFKIIDDTEAPEQENGSNEQIISQEDLGGFSPSAIDLSEMNEVTEDRSNSVAETPRSLKTLEEIRKSVTDTLNSLQKNNRNAIESIKYDLEEISTQRDSTEERNHNIDLIDNENQLSNVEPTFTSASSAIPVYKELRDTCESTKSVSFQDLQKMSDSILMASEKNGQGSDPNDGNISESKEDNSDFEKICESDIDNVLGMDKSESTELKPKNDLNQVTDDSYVVSEDKALCPSDLFDPSDKNKHEKITTDIQNKENDLEPLASDPIINILRPTSLTSKPIINILRPNSKSLVEHLNDFETKLRQSIVQPTPLINVDDLNIFRTPSFNIPDISGLNANLPTLDEIRTRVSEILSGLARTTDEEDNSSELDSDDFASEVNHVVSKGASASSPISILPALKPLEDINLDIVQLKPLPSMLGFSPQRLSLPGLNLNRYKAKLAVPKSLDLKPLNLASTLGNNRGFVGATLSVGPEKKGMTNNPIFRNSDLHKTLRGTGSNPKFVEITSNIHKNALNLLNTPKNTHTPVLQASKFADDLKSYTEDTIRSIHETVNPSPLDNIHSNLIKNSNNFLSSGRSSLEKASTPINAAVDNLKSQTEKTFKQLHNRLQSSRASDLSDAIQKNTHNILKSSRGSVEVAVDNLKAQSENTFKNIQQTLDTSALSDINKSIHKTAQNILRSSPIAPPRDILGGTMQAIPPIHKVADNLRSHTKSALNSIQQTLISPTISDINTSLQKSAQEILNSPMTNIRVGNLKSALQPSSSIDAVVDNLKSQTQSTMRSIQNSLNTPSLADVSATVQKHAQNLLDSPVAFTGQNAVEKVLQPMNLAPHVEQVAKDLQKTLKATLKNSPIRDLPPLPHPNDVIQMISNHHEDVNDKLYALHTDLNDRLETIHNEVTDPERLRSILSPPGNRHFELFAIPLPLGPRSVPSAQKQTKPRLQSEQPSLTAQRKQPKKNASKAFKPRTETAKLGSMRSATGKEKSSPKSFRIPSAASSPIPTRINKPILPVTPIKPFKGLQGIKMPLVPKPTQNKITVTFGPTTPRSLAVSKSKEVPTTLKPRVSNDKRFKSKPIGPVRQPTPWNGWGKARSAPKRLDPVSSPSLATNVRTPLKSQPTKPITKPLKTETSRLSSVSTKPKSTSKSIFKTTPLTQTRNSNPGSQLLPFNRPKSPFLSKLSEALKSKPIGTNLGSSRATNNVELTPAASDRFEKVVPLDESLRENVPYKCKMMCVKVDLNEE